MIYLLRHGETIWNTVGRFQGRKDSPLTLKSYVSPLGRAKETATRIAKIVPLTFEEEPRLMEVSVGSWDGMTLYEIGAEYPDALNGSDAFNWFFRSPNGESCDQACKRVGSWLSEVSATTIAISHGLTSRSLRGVYLGLSEREMLELPVPQSGFYQLQDGKSELVGGDQPNFLDKR